MLHDDEALANGRRATCRRDVACCYGVMHDAAGSSGWAVKGGEVVRQHLRTEAYG